MLNTTRPPLRPALVGCPNAACGARGRSGVHSIQHRRYTCHAWGTTCAATVGTPLDGLQHPTWLVVVVLAVLACGWPLPAIGFACGSDERTVTDWQLQAGPPAQQLPEQEGGPGQIDRGQVPGDERSVKPHDGTVWMALAMRVFARVWRWGAVAPQRDPALLTQVVQHVRAAAQFGQPIMGASDGCAAWVTAIRSGGRDAVRTGKRGRPPLVVWPELHIVHGVTQSTGRRLTGVHRRLAHGCLQAAEAILQARHGGLGGITPAALERLHGTWRTWLPAVPRRSRTPARQAPPVDAAMGWTGGGSNCGRVPTTLQGTLALAADVTDQVWTIDELLRHRVKRE